MRFKRYESFHTRPSDVPPPTPQEMIDEADRDGDGEINEEEFLRIMKKTSLYWSRNGIMRGADQPENDFFFIFIFFNASIFFNVG